MHLRSSIVKVCCAKYFMIFDVTFTGRRFLKGRRHLLLNWRPFDLQSNALPLNYIPMQVAPWLLQNSKDSNFPIFSLFFVLVATLPQALTIFYRIGSYLLGFSPAIRIPMFDSPPKHLRSSVVKVCHANYFMKFNVTFTGLLSLIHIWRCRRRG